MDCIKYRKMISSYVDNELDEFEVDNVLVHLKECSSCKVFYENLLILKDEVKNSYMENNYDYDCLNDVMTKLNRNVVHYKNKKVGKIFIAVAAIFLFAISLLLFNKSQNSNEMASDYKLEKYVAEHLEKYRPVDLNRITNVNYDK